MNRNGLLGFAAGAVFTIGLAVGLLGLDAIRDDGDGGAAVPEALGDPIPLIAGELALDETDPVQLVVDAGYEPTEVVGEYVPVSSPAGGLGEFADFGDPSEEGAPDGGALPAEPPFEGEASGLPIGFSAIDLLFETFEFPFLRFLDYCADNPTDPICPLGVGGTVLAPVDDHLGSIGEFDLADTLYRQPGTAWYRCEEPTDLGEDGHLLMLLANHPARIEVTYYPRDTPSDRTSVVIDETVPSRPEFGRFLDTVAATGGPAWGQDQVHHCFVLHGGPGARVYTIEAAATSFSGETDSATYSFTTTDRRGRPPVILSPITDNRLVVVVPVQSDREHSDLVRVIGSGEGLGCGDIERSVLAGDRRAVVPGTGSGLAAQESLSDSVINSPTWRYDPAYDRRDFWMLDLEEGSHYRLCIFWVRSAARSFDSASVVEREAHLVSTPDRLQAAISVVGVTAPSRGDLPVGAFTLEGCGGIVRALPTEPVARGTGILHGGISLCSATGFRQLPVTEIVARWPEGGSKRFAVATPNTGEPRTELVNLDLSRETSGLCGSSFGDCDPPRRTVPGPIVHLEVEFSDGAVSGQSEWSIDPISADAPPTEPPGELPEQIRLDYFNSDVAPIDRNTLRLTAAFDRPVHLSADFIGDRAGMCFAAEASAPYISSEPSVTHTYDFTRLCPLTWYSVWLTATDEDGNTTVYAPDAVTRPGALGWVAGTERTAGYHSLFTVSYRYLSSEAWSSRFDVIAPLSPIIDLRPSRESNGCLAGSQSLPVEGEWGFFVEVRIDVGVGEARLVDGRCVGGESGPGRGAWAWSASVVSSFTVDEFRAGPIEIPVPLVPIGSESPAFSGTVLFVTIEGSVDG